MLVYEGIKSGFINDVDLGIIADKIRNKYIEKFVPDVILHLPYVLYFPSWTTYRFLSFAIFYIASSLYQNEI